MLKELLDYLVYYISLCQSTPLMDKKMFRYVSRKRLLLKLKLSEKGIQRKPVFFNLIQFNALSVKNNT